MKFSISEISEIIELAWDDQTDFSHITIWRKRIAQRSAQKTQLKGRVNA
jgi:hypothetical protein